MAAKVIFVNQNDKAQSFKVNLFGSGRNRVKVANVLAVFKASVAIMGDGSIMEADDDGLSMDTFNSGATYTITCLPQGCFHSPQLYITVKYLVVRSCRDSRTITGCWISPIHLVLQDRRFLAMTASCLNIIK